VRHGVVDMDRILNIGGFDLDRALASDPRFLKPDFPFEWAAVYHLKPGRYELVFEKSTIPALQLCLLPSPVLASPPEPGRERGAFVLSGQEALDAVQMDAVLLFSSRGQPLSPGAELKPGAGLCRLDLPPAGARFSANIADEGTYALFAEHHLDEFQARLIGSQGPVAPVYQHRYREHHDHEHCDQEHCEHEHHHHGHRHDEEVKSVGITIAGDLNEKRLNEWLQQLLATRGQDIFRMKGVLSIKGDRRRFVFQGVHMTFDSRPDRPWASPEERHNAMIFIGRHLDRRELEEGFRACLA
jgi:hypothetical protein